MAEYNPSKIIKDGNTYNFRDNTKIPLAGTSALAGSIVPSTDNAYDLGDSTYGFKDIYTNKLYLKGSTIFNVVDDNYICVGGATAQSNGANLVLNGKNRSTSTGEFKLEARDGTNTRQLIGKPDGTLTWNGKNIDCIEEQGTGYIRYTNGIQICWGSLSWQSACSTSWGALYETSAVNGSYAKSFVGIPSVSALGYVGTSSAFVEATAGSGTSTPTFYLCRGTTRNDVTECSIRYMAIGRWK